MEELEAKLAIAEGYSVSWTQNGAARSDLADANVDALYTNGGDSWVCTVDTGSSTVTSSAVSSRLRCTRRTARSRSAARTLTLAPTTLSG